MMAGSVRELTDSTFTPAVSSGVSLVDFWAPWCPPCRAQGPIVEGLAADYAGRALVAKVNVDEQGAAAGKFGIANIPTILIMKDGREVTRFVGLRAREELAAALDGEL